MRYEVKKKLYYSDVSQYCPSVNLPNTHHLKQSLTGMSLWDVFFLPWFPDGMLGPVSYGHFFLVDPFIHGYISHSTVVHVVCIHVVGIAVLWYVFQCTAQLRQIKQFTMFVPNFIDVCAIVILICSKRK